MTTVVVRYLADEAWRKRIAIETGVLPPSWLEDRFDLSDLHRVDRELFLEAGFMESEGHQVKIALYDVDEMLAGNRYRPLVSAGRLGLDEIREILQDMVANEIDAHPMFGRGGS